MTTATLTATPDTVLLSRRPAFSQAEVSNAAAVERAIAVYRQGAVTLARAAEIAGVTRWEMARILKAHGIPVTVEVPPVVEMDRDLAAYLE